MFILKNKIARYSLQRFLQMLPSLLGIIVLVFLILHLIPGDAARLMLGTRANQEDLDALRQSLGLDKPLIIQFFIYIKNLLRFDLGVSIISHQQISDEIKVFFPATLELSIVAIIIASVFGVLLGILAALKRNTWLDYSTTTVSLLGVSMPIYWLGLIMIMLFSVHLKIFPTGGRVSTRLFFEPITNYYILDGFIYLLKTGNPQILFVTIRHIILPGFTLGLLPMATISRITRTSMLEVLQQDYIQTAIAMGISRTKVIFQYALKNALLPVVTVIGTQFGTLLSGAILTETIFAWPGLGRWMYQAISARDYPAVQGGVIVIAVTFLLINFIVDILYTVINPKITLD